MSADGVTRGGAPSPAEEPGGTVSENLGKAFCARVFMGRRSAGAMDRRGTVFFSRACPVLVLLGMLIDPRSNDRPQRWLSRNVVRLAGARVEVKFAPGFDPRRTSFFVSNHVNLFDPFVLYGAVPQFVRGLELESHFRIPAYGWMMRRFGNVPVPEGTRPSDLKRMWRLARAAVDQGVSLIVFPEGKRTH